jgi:hypothetical protein
VSLLKFFLQFWQQCIAWSGTGVTHADVFHRCSVCNSCAISVCSFYSLNIQEWHFNSPLPYLLRASSSARNFYFPCFSVDVSTKVWLGRWWLEFGANCLHQPVNWTSGAKHPLSNPRGTALICSTAYKEENNSKTVIILMYTQTRYRNIVSIQ